MITYNRTIVQFCFFWDGRPMTEVGSGCHVLNCGEKSLFEFEKKEYLMRNCRMTVVGNEVGCRKADFGESKPKRQSIEFLNPWIIFPV